MIDVLRHSLAPARLLAVAFAAITPLAFAARPIDDGIYYDADPALGISSTFGRWNSTIKLVYDPDGAPAAYANSDKFLALVREAYGYWMRVSGVRFEIVGIDSNAPNDRNWSNPDLRDGLVRIAWGPIDAAGRAGPSSDWFDRDLGYFPYNDGSIELSNAPNVNDSDFDLMRVLVHEMGHLLGLGHSDNPDSVLYANPYNFLLYPRADDIRAMQALYGPPALPLDPASPVPEWLYSPPPLASAAARQFLFPPDVQTGAGGWFQFDNSEATSVTAAVPNDSYLWFGGRYGGSSSTVNLDATFVVVDPSGYIYDERAWSATCRANSLCTGFMSVAQAGVMKTQPGTWTVYVVDNATNRTLASGSIPVNTTVSFNKPPTATVTAAPGSSPNLVQFTLTATDPEGSMIDVYWHRPGIEAAYAGIASGASTAITVSFPQTGTHTFFAELRDRTPRYGDGQNSSAAGEGFQTLLRITVTLPAATVQVVSSQDSGSTQDTQASQQVLSAIAATPGTQLVTHVGSVNAVSNAGVGFSYGASRDQGLTTGTNFNSGDNVIVAGKVAPLPADVGKSGELYVVIHSVTADGEGWAYRDGSGNFVDWDTRITTLKPTASVTLKSSEAFQIYSGKLQPAQHRVYIGYRVAGSATLFYTGIPLKLTVN